VGSSPAPHARAALTVRTVPSAFDEEEFRLFCAYQAAVHNEAAHEQTPESYSRFLCDSPLAGGVAGLDVTGGPPAYGTYHQQYRLGERLVAVGVLDLLPGGLSSAYVFYDPALARALQPGKLSALHEIGWLAQLRCAAGAGGETLRWYHLGLYLPTCPKMAYKATYRPSQLFCPITQTWVPFQAAAPRLAGGGSAPLADLASGSDACGSSGGGGAGTLDDCLVLLSGPGREREEPRHLAAAERALPPAARPALRRAAGLWRDAVGGELSRRAALVYWPQDGGGDGDEGAA